MKLHRVLLVVALAFLMAAGLMPESNAAQRLVLVEGFTQWNCGPCASWNPQERSILEAFTRDTVVAMKIHGWWPGQNNDMYHLWNVSETTARINLYGCNWVPWGMCDGIIDMRNVSQNLLRNSVRSRYALSSPCTIDFNASVAGETSISFSGSVNAESDMLNANTKLFAALIVDRVQYQSPPGSNGETIFDNIFRDFWPNSTGQSFTLNAGDTYEFSGTLTKDATMDVDDLSVIVFVQTMNNKEILQSELVEVNRFYGMEMTTTDPGQLIVQPNNGDVLYYLDLNNTGVNEDTYTVTLDGDIPANWVRSIETTGVPGDPNTIQVTIPGESMTTLVAHMNPNGNAGSATFTVSVTSPNLPDLELEETFRLMSGLDVLLVDDDEGAALETYYETAMDAAEVEGVIGRWDVSADALDAAYFEGLDLVIWFTGSGWANGTTLSAQDQLTLGDFLDAGGNLLVTGQGIGFDCRTDPFFTEYLHANYHQNYPQGTSVLGVDGDPITNGMEFNISGGDGANNQTRQSVISSHDEFSTLCFTYADVSRGAALRISTETFRIVYLAFGFEAIATQAARDALMDSAVQWLMGGTAVDDPNELVPGEFALGQNFPNPFNPETTIPYMLPDRADVTLHVFDVLGREVATLAQGMQEAGAHAIDWNASELTSGIYFYRLEAALNGHVNQATRKLMLLK